MKNIKKLLIIIVLVICIMGAFFYKKERNNIYKELEETLSTIPCKYEIRCTEEFNDLIKIFQGETYYYTNSKLKKINSTLLEQISDNSCFLEEYKPNYQLDRIEDIINEISNNSSLTHIENMQAAYIYTDDFSGNYIEKSDGYIDTKIVIVDENNNIISDEDAKIKVRGNSTASAEKKAYNIKFSEKQDVFGFGEAKKWSLLADCFDPTLMRNKLALDLAKDLGLEYTSNCDYVELWLDGVYKGCYLLTESVEAGSSRVDIDSDDNEFLIEFELKRVEEDVTYVVTNDGIRFAISEPEEPTEEQLANITNILNNIENVINSNDINQIKNVIDLDSFVKYYLLNEFFKTVDVAYSSVNFYYKNGKLFAGPVWDFDLSSGNCDTSYYSQYWNYDESLASFESYTKFYVTNNPIFIKLVSNNNFYMMIKNYFLEIKEELKNVFVENGKIDQLLEKNSDIYIKNYQIKDDGGAGWNVDNKYTTFQLNPLKTYDLNVDYLKKMARKKIQLVAR